MPDGSIITAGWVRKPNNDVDGVIFKTDANGVPQWFRYYGAEGSFDSFYGVDIANNGNYIAAGERNGDVYVVEVNPSGGLVRSATYNTGVAEVGASIRRNGTGMIIGGSLWANQARALVSARGGASTELDYWFLQATVVSAPLTILAGIGVLAGVLFLAAGVWNRR